MKSGRDSTTGKEKVPNVDEKDKSHFNLFGRFAFYPGWGQSLHQLQFLRQHHATLYSMALDDGVCVWRLRSDRRGQCIGPAIASGCGMGSCGFIDRSVSCAFAHDHASCGISVDSILDTGR